MARAGELRIVGFEGADAASLPYVDIRRALGPGRVVRVRGLFDPEEVLRARRRIAEQFDSGRDRKHDPRDTEAIRGNFQKLHVGFASGLDPTRVLGRFLRMLYNPIFAPDIHGMRRHFVTLARFRNLLYGLAPDFAVRSTEDGYWTAARIHQYPRGGGFMTPHRDAYNAAAVEGAAPTYNQAMLVMTRKGVDFGSGGAFVVHRGGYGLYEDEVEIGDVVVYDGRAVHGVSDVDPLEPLDMTVFNGRVVAFASLFRHLRPGAEDYGAIARHARRRRRTRVSA
jgi:hypothetical protein